MRLALWWNEDGEMRWRSAGLPPLAGWHRLVHYEDGSTNWSRWATCSAKLPSEPT